MTSDGKMTRDTNTVLSKQKGESLKAQSATTQQQQRLMLKQNRAALHNPNVSNTIASGPNLRAVCLQLIQQQRMTAMGIGRHEHLIGKWPSGLLLAC